MAKLLPGHNTNDAFDSQPLTALLDFVNTQYPTEDVLRMVLRKWGIDLDTQAVDWSDPQKIIDGLTACTTLGEVLRLFPDEKPINENTRQLREQILMQDMEAAKRAWRSNIVSEKVLNLVADQLKDFASQWDGHQWYAPLTALVQSSGWGKSCLIFQMWRMGFYVVYISCMKESQSGFSRRTGELADIMQGPKYTESTFVALVVSILAVLNQHPGMACEEWMAAQEKDDAIQHEILAVFQTKSIEVITDKPYFAAEEDQKKFCQVEIDKLKQRGARVLLCVDEAGELGDNFLKFRRSLRSMPRGDSFFGIVLGTDRKVADLAAAQEDDQSARARLSTHFNVFHPIYLIGKSDIFAQVGAGSSDITNPCNAI